MKVSCSRRCLYECCDLNSGASFYTQNLLFQLLANEIRVEQNTLLQCIRHIVKNNFFHTEKTISGGDRVGTVQDSVNDEERLLGKSEVENEGVYDDEVELKGRQELHEIVQYRSDARYNGNAFVIACKRVRLCVRSRSSLRVNAFTLAFNRVRHCV